MLVPLIVLHTLLSGMYHMHIITKISRRGAVFSRVTTKEWFLERLAHLRVIK